MNTRAPWPAHRYDRIGQGYAGRRRTDPRVSTRIWNELGDSATVVNVGAGTGSYEPPDRLVLAIEPSSVMLGQRPTGAGQAVRATANALPLANDSVDAAMAILSVHHWDAAREHGVRELRRVARGPVVILTYDPEVSGQMWLMSEYLTEVAALDHRIFPTAAQLREWLGGRVDVEVVPIPADTPDWSLGSFWAHPERVLDPAARAATSGFARQPQPVVTRVADAVRRDLQDGSWDRRHGHLRNLTEYDAGLRLVVARP